MRKIVLKQTKYFIVAFLILFFIAGRPVEFGQEKQIFQGYPIPKPVIRIGLGVNLTDIKIQATLGMKVYEAKSTYRLVAEDVFEVQVKGYIEKVIENYILLVGQRKERKEAERLAENLQKKIQKKVYVEEEREENLPMIFQVKVGEFPTREEALSYMQYLNELGMKDIWILREETTVSGSRPLWLLVADELKPLTSDTTLYFIPSSPQSLLSYNGRKYRGIFLLKSTAKGIVLINILNLEDYLKGVVPGELSPQSFSELEALKAQAVAARTYALANLDSYKNLGYDLCDTPKSQLYQGMDGEHPLSSRAVEETRGEAALYRGKLINALYTSTCGGMTEDVENVFEGNAVPYLKSTECQFEKQEEWVLKTRMTFFPVWARGKNINFQLAQLYTLDIIPYTEDSFFYSQEATFEETVDWIKKALVFLGKKVPLLEQESSPLSFLNLARLIEESFGWKERSENLLIPKEVQFLTKDFHGMKEKDKRNLAYLILMGIFPLSQDISCPEKVLSRAEVAYSLHKIISGYKDILHRGRFKRMNRERTRIEIEEEGETRQFSLSDRLFLLRNLDGETSFASEVDLLGGEEVRWIEKQGVIALLEVRYPSRTISSDRFSFYYRWQVRKSREELEIKINQSYPIGGLVDIIPKKRGKSKRVTELLILGEEKKVLISGLRIRWILGLRDTLFVIDREYESNGGVAYFTFCGKGWGHGVGLCQVGAYGMAAAGANYKDILKKYYQGIKIEKIY